MALADLERALVRLQNSLDGLSDTRRRLNTEIEGAMSVTLSLIDTYQLILDGQDVWPPSEAGKPGAAAVELMQLEKNAGTSSGLPVQIRMEAAE